MAKVKDLDKRGRARVQTTGYEETLTVQSDIHQADIKRILERYKEIGVIDHLKHVDAVYKDITEFTDLADALNQSKAAEKEFMKLPSKVREVFNHNVAEWLDTAHDPEKQAIVGPKLEALGVFKKLKAPVVEAPSEAPPALDS